MWMIIMYKLEQFIIVVRGQEGGMVNKEPVREQSPTAQFETEVFLLHNTAAYIIYVYVRELCVCPSVK